MPCDIVGDRAAGAAITLPFWPGPRGEVRHRRADADRSDRGLGAASRFGWTWGGDLLIFELIAIGGDTQLVFTTWPEDPELAGLVSAAGGYHLCLAELTLLLDDGSAPPMTDVDEVAFRLTEEYRQHVRLS